ncbi:MAG TPA: ATP-binding cassette domain-containing protein [Erysipelotrichaceae bacterium]|nr:ATP-binding cassette domain-containing protein [Erysipelotrichaceae bacterium]
MLRLLNIDKNYYIKDQKPVRALRKVSINFRRSEFVAVLGPSGCGKTTLLNIIGGLDRYTRGDLIIKKKSTKNYTDYDWDTYRNHSVGFVFQSYNLIGHQTLAKNVELALTIAGVPRKERKERAYKALEQVGLKGLERKKPNQLSGGQMQRVAIARALVNNPEILLADEPTGALDSETSTQVIDLLKEVAKDRLVIMVTHNPDLARRYATRIVNMFDGVITGDSNPYDGRERKGVKRVKKVKKGTKSKSSMSFFTATALSVANLISKARRTILVAFAGSVGIFGVSTVLAASTGVRNYIDSMQDDMLSSYPLAIAEESVDYSSLMEGIYSGTTMEISDFDPSTHIGLNSLIDYMLDRYKDLSTVKTNTINEDLVQFVKEIPEEYVSAMSFDYGTDVTNNIFTAWKPNETEEEKIISLNGLTQRYIAELKTVKGFSQYATYVDLFTGFMRLLPGETEDKEYILSQYDLLGDSRFPENENEIVLVVGNDTTLTDLNFAQLGYYQEEEVMNIAQKAITKYDENNTLTEEELDEKFPYRTSFTYEDVLGKKLYYAPHDSIYRYDDIKIRDYVEYSATLTDMVNSQMYILQYDESNDIISGGLVKLAPFDYEIIYFVRMGAKDPTKNPIYGSWAGSNIDQTATYAFNLVEGEATANVIVNPGEPGQTINNVAVSVSAIPREEKITGYQYPAVVDIDTIADKTELTISGILRPKEDILFGCLNRGVYYTKAFQDKYMEDTYDSEIIRDETNGILSYIGSENEKASPYKAYVTFEYTDYTDFDNPVVKANGYASCLNGDLTTAFVNLFGALGGVNYAEQDAVYLRSLCGLKKVTHVDEDDNVTYTFEKLPDTMRIYPVDFEMKNKINDYLDSWNEKGDIVLYKGTAQEKTLTSSERDELSYTDTISLIITIIDTMITIVTTALVIFTSLSLVVSCFMIAVITYISVMERVKEIGVIRSLGGRKKDVSRLFIAENLIIGVLSGLIGLAFTVLICSIINLVISSFGIPLTTTLTIPIGIIMLSLSVVLSVLSGLIPSVHASKQDPVVALRTE